MKVNMKLEPEKYFEERGKKYIKQLLFQLQDGELVDRIFNLITSREYQNKDTFEQSRILALFIMAENNRAV